MDINTANDVAAIADLAKASLKPEVVTLPGGRVFIAHHEDLTVNEVSDPHGFKPAPSRIVQGVTLQTVDSLVDYANRFKSGGSALFADIARNSISAVLDYHAPGAPSNVEHVATMSLPYSEEWKCWMAIHDKKMPQLDFARFIEENAVDVAAPTGAALLEVVRDLQAVRKVDFKKAVRTNSDNENFEYTDETTAGTKNGSVEIPSKFQLRLPVYFGGRNVELYAFLRWALIETQLVLGVALHRAEHVRQAVFKEIVGDVAERTGLPIVYGALTRAPGL